MANPIFVSQPIKKYDEDNDVLTIRCPAGAYFIGDPSTFEDIEEIGNWYNDVGNVLHGVATPEKGPPCIMVSTGSDGAFDGCRISTDVACFCIVPFQYMTTSMKENVFKEGGYGDYSALHTEKEDFDCLIIGNYLEDDNSGVQRIELGSETFKIWENGDDEDGNNRIGLELMIKTFENTDKENKVLRNILRNEISHISTLKKKNAMTSIQQQVENETIPQNNAEDGEKEDIDN